MKVGEAHDSKPLRWRTGRKGLPVDLTIWRLNVINLARCPIRISSAMMAFPCRSSTILADAGRGGWPWLLAIGVAKRRKATGLEREVTALATPGPGPRRAERPLTGPSLMAR